MFQFRNTKNIAGIGVFPLPIMVIKVAGGLLPMMCECRR